MGLDGSGTRQDGDGMTDPQSVEAENERLSARVKRLEEGIQEARRDLSGYFAFGDAGSLRRAGYALDQAGKEEGVK